MLPVITILVLNNYLPMFGIIVAFKNFNYADGFWGSPWRGMENFKYLFATRDSYIITRNTILYNSLFIILLTVVPIAFAIMLNELRSRFFAKVHQTFMFLPYFLSPVVLSYVVFGFLGENGFMNSTILPFFGLEHVSWYFEKKFWPFILPLVFTWKNVAYYTVIYMAAILAIDDEYYEAATIDGATKWRQLWNITLPLIVPVMIMMIMLQFSKIFYADFQFFYLVPRESGMLFEVTNVIDTYVYRTFIAFGDIGLSSAAGFYQAIVGFTLVLIFNWIVRRINKENAMF